MTKLRCPAETDLEQMLQGDLTDERLEHLSQHLSSCPTCVERLESMPQSREIHDAIRKRTSLVQIDEAIQRGSERARQIFDQPDLHDTITGKLDETLASQESPTVQGQTFPFLAPPEQHGELGRLGKYRVLQVLGQGGMGVVFKAHDPQLKRDVALKVLWMARPISPEIRQRFLQEARALASIDHENVVPVYSVEEEGETPFLTMKLLAGQSLADRLRHGRLDNVATLRLARELAAALQAAHKTGVIHRDVKPANIWLEPTGAVKLIDFGLARTADLELTQSGNILGTPKYMSPEQASGQPVGEQSDLFSLGSVLYHAVAGQVPFVGESLPALFTSIVAGNFTSLSSAAPAANQEIVRIVERLLATSREDRYPNADALIADLDRLGPSALVTEPKPVPKSASHRNSAGKALAWCAAGLAGVALVATIVLTLRDKNGEVVLRFESSDKAVKLDLGRGTKLTIPDPGDGQNVQVEVDQKNRIVRISKPGFQTIETPLGDGSQPLGVRFVQEPAAPARAVGEASELDPAQWVLSMGGEVIVTKDYQEFVTVQRLADLPKTDALLFGATLSDRQTVTARQLENLQGCDTLEILKLERTPVGNDVIQQLQKLPKIRNVSLSQTKIDDKALQGLAQMQLEILHITGTATTDKGLSHLAKHPHLEYLISEFTGISNDGLKHLASIPNLAILVVGHNDLGDAALKHLADATSLEELTLNNTHVTNAGLEHLRGLSKLKKLVLTDTQVTEIGIQQLKKSLPNCQIIK